MSSWSLYWILMLDNIGLFFFVLSVVFGVCWAVFTAFTCIEGYAEDVDSLKVLFKKAMRLRFIGGLLILITLATLMPSTKQAAAIYVIPKIVNKIDQSQIPSQMEDLATEWLKYQTQELKSKMSQKEK